MRYIIIASAILLASCQNKKSAPVNVVDSVVIKKDTIKSDVPLRKFIYGFILKNVDYTCSGIGDYYSKSFPIYRDLKLHAYKNCKYKKFYKISEMTVISITEMKSQEDINNFFSKQ